MARTIYLRIEGRDDVARRLRALPTAVRRRVLRGAAFSGARVIQQEAIRNARRGGPSWPDVITGVLVKNIVVARDRKVKGDSAGYWIEVRRKRRKYVAGTGRRRRRRAGREYLSNQNEAYYGNMVELGVMRNGNRVPAQPFQRPAFDSKKFEANRIIWQRLEQGIQREAQRIANRGR